MGGYEDAAGRAETVPLMDGSSAGTRDSEVLTRNRSKRRVKLPELTDFARTESWETAIAATDETAL